MSGRMWISTTTYSKAYLGVAWKNRGELKDYERRGFAQFVYLTMCAHLEGLLADLIRQRLHSIKHMVIWERLPPMNLKQGDQTHSCELRPIYESLFRMADSLSDQSHNAPLQKLKETYNVLFSPPLTEVIGKELNEDLEALGALRNLFAHGRDLFLNFEGQFPQAYATLDSNPIELPAKRLKHAGIMKDLKITGSNHDEFHSAFYRDEALMYFYEAIEQIEEKVRANLTFLPEKAFPVINPLPKLQI